jgi:hypothetical protein
MNRLTDDSPTLQRRFTEYRENVMGYRMGRRRVGNLVMGVVAACSILASSGAAAEPPEMDGPFLVNDLAAARAEARKTGKPIFVVFRCEQ